ncbi:MAG TPA: helix-turn-helix domain-containing protein [Gaiellales bacterium]|jgi:predicted ArsR family transcriptional regulator|nr:helix-turn-helix domain-containing protein [Gaiellales bacterium]
MTTPKRTLTLTDPRALRALAHPTRMKLVGLLRRHGPLTATRAGALLGEVPASASFHLRQLAKYGLVEEAPGGKGRERPWQATARFTSWSGVGGGPQMQAAAQLLSSVVADRYHEMFIEWLEQRAEEPIEWQEAAHQSDFPLYLTAEELRDLGERLVAELEPYLERTSDPARRPAGSRMVTVIQLAFPTEAPDAN